MVPVITGVLGLVGQWLNGRQEVSRAKAEAKVTRIQTEAELQQKAIDNDSAWERLQAQGSMDSWKDEAWTIFFIGMLLLGFWPGGSEWLDQWVAYVNALPEWVSIGIIISISASFGVRGLDKLMGRK